MADPGTPFKFAPNPAGIVFGPGRLSDLSREATDLGIERALIVCSDGRRAIAERAADHLEALCAGISPTAAANMPRQAFDRAMADLAEAKADGIIALGGGSAIGLGKALTIKSGLPHIAVPTTYSGSELRPDWRIEDENGVEGGVDEAAMAKTVIYDPELTLDLTPSVSGPSGMNAAAHAVESLYFPGADPVSITMGEEGLRLLADSLPKVVAAPADLEARSTALRGAWLAGGFRAGSCLEHRMAQRLRSLCDLTHCLSHAVCLPYVVAFNEGFAPDAMARIARALGRFGEDGAAEGLFRLNAALSIPATLAEIGMDAVDLDRAAAVIADVEIPNPRPVTRQDVRDLLELAYRGR